MKRRGLFIQILAPFLALSVATLTVATLEATRFLEKFHRAEVSGELEAFACVFRKDFLNQLNNQEQINALCKEFGGLAGKRVTVVSPSGKVLGDSTEDPSRMDNHSDRPEIRDALNGKSGVSIRFSNTLHTDFMYVAVPIDPEKQNVGVLRVSASLASVDRALRAVYMKMALATSIVGILGGFAGLLIARRIIRPLHQMKKGAERFAKGDLSGRLSVPDVEELTDLAVAMNRMAGQLDEHFHLIHRQRDELQAVLSSMDEGVIAVDGAEHVVSVNCAAAKLLGVDSETSKNRPIEEVVRSPKLQQCVAKTLTDSETVREETTFGGAEERILHVVTTVLRDETQTPEGVLLVLNDVTSFRRAERARSEFVANVSHEIRTPVTSIKGYAETLLDGALDDRETARRFLGIIARQSDRLTSLVDDILALASLEKSETTADVIFEKSPVIDVIDSATNVCVPKASERKISLITKCNPELTASLNAALIEQAIVNLVDNAIKCSEPETAVEIEAEIVGEKLVIKVCDAGCGIASEHLPHIFERFYRVDRARSRQLGGTGLGLAIVKHIAAVHGGSVTVESVLGKGSVFTISLPDE
jgi:two-component system phosphate regulon sensor histidine kinase PhoR